MRVLITYSSKTGNTKKLAEAIREWEAVSAIDPNYKDVNKNLTKAKTLYERLESIKRSKTQENTQ